MNKLKNMKKYILLSVILLILALSMSTYHYYSLKNNNGNIDSKKLAKYRISNEFLIKHAPEKKGRQFKSASNSRGYIFIKVKNIKTQERMDIVCLLSEWKNICLYRIKLIKNESEFEKFMNDEYIEKKGERIFDIDDILYSELDKFEAKKFYKGKQKIRERPLNSIKDLY